MFKNIISKIIIIVIFICLLPLLLIISIIILVDDGSPIIFRQKRVGRGNTLFWIYKFRTMYYQRNQSKITKQAVQNDPRVTKVGRYLRSLSLDELPQLINVLKGDMSLVGPRPHAVDHNEFYRKKIHGYMQRHSCKPGMTGLAQIRGFRGNTETEEQMRKRVDADLEYLSNWSIKEDILICKSVKV